MQDRAQILVRAAAGDLDAQDEARDILLAGLQTYWRAGGQIPLERAVGLPTSTARQQQAKLVRNYWLGRAFAHVCGESAWVRLLGLEREIKTFQSIILPGWVDLPEPPPGASELRSALFRAERACPGKMPTSWRHLRRLLTKFDDAVSVVSGQKCNLNILPGE